MLITCIYSLYFRVRADLNPGVRWYGMFQGTKEWSSDPDERAELESETDRLSNSNRTFNMDRLLSASAFRFGCL